MNLMTLYLFDKWNTKMKKELKDAVTGLLPEDFNLFQTLGNFAKTVLDIVLAPYKLI